MDDSLVNRILNMYKSPEPLNIVMPAPTNRRRKEDRYTLDDEPDLCSGTYSKESETDYIKEYVQKDEDEYFKVINIKICNNIGYLYFAFSLLPTISCS